MLTRDAAVETSRDFWTGAVPIVLITGAAYWGVLGNGFIWDDSLRVYENASLQSLDGLRQIWLDVAVNKQYYPLTFSTFWIEYHLWGFDPTGFHVVNVLIHSVAAVLLWRLLAFLGVPGAWAAGALFALHPVHVESVAWVSERKNVMSAAFYLASARVYLGWALADVKIDRRYWIALLLFLCALFSKTVTCTLPAALLLLLWWKRRRIELRDFSRLLPFFVLGVGLGLLTAWLEKHEVGAMGFDWDYSFLERCLLAGRIVCFYLGKLLWPEPLIFFYPRWEIDSAIWWQYLFSISLLLLAVSLWLARERIGRGPLVGLLFFTGTLFPALGFIDVYPMRFSFVADHFQYLASVGPIALFAAAGASGARKLGALGTRIACAVLVLVLLTHAGLIRRQLPTYHSIESLWRDTIAKNPAAFLAHYNLGNLVRQQGSMDEAQHHYEMSIQANPRYELAYNNLATLHAAAGRVEEAIATYRHALVLRPNYWLAHSNLGALLAKHGEFEPAVSHFREALRIVPDDPATHLNLARALTAIELPDDAFPHYVEARRLRREASEKKTSEVLEKREAQQGGETHP